LFSDFTDQTWWSAPCDPPPTKSDALLRPIYYCDGSGYGEAQPIGFCPGNGLPDYEPCNSCGGITSTGVDCTPQPPPCEEGSDDPGCRCHERCCPGGFGGAPTGANGAPGGPGGPALGDDESGGEGGPVDGSTGVLWLQPVVDVRLRGAFDDDIVFRRNYASGSAYGSALRSVDVPGQQLFFATGWVHNFQARLIDLRTYQAQVLAFTGEDGQGYRFHANLSDSTGEGWTAATAQVTNCGGVTSSGYVLTKNDGAEYRFDSTLRLVSRRAPTGRPVTSCYDAGGRLERVQNESGQSIWFTYQDEANPAFAPRLYQIRLGASNGPVLVTYGYTSQSLGWPNPSQPKLVRQLTGVCYGPDCSGETFSYLYGGGSVLRLLTEIRHGNALVERHEYCAQAGGCAIARKDSVRFSTTRTRQLSFSYADTGCQGGTKIEDSRIPVGDPTRSSCATFTTRNRLSTSTSPAGCNSDVRELRWPTAGRDPSASASPRGGVDESGKALLTWTSWTYDSQHRVTAEVEHASGFGSDPPAGVSRTTTYAYGDNRFPRRPTRIGRPSVLGTGEATTEYAYDAAGNAIERHETGWTRTSAGVIEPYHYVTYTDHTDVGNGVLRPWRISGPVAYAQGQNHDWHTEYRYYPASGDDDARRGYRLKQIARRPLCPTGATCAAEFLEIEYLGYDDFGRPTLTRNATGDETATTYDVRGRVTSVSNAGGTTTTEYDATGRIRGVTLPTGNGIHYYYAVDSYGIERLRAVTRTTGSAAGLGNTLPVGTERLVYTHDGQGNVTVEETYRNVAAGALTSELRDRRVQREYYQGRLSKVLTAGGDTAIEMTLDPASGAVVSRTERPSGSASRTTDYTYSWGRLVSADETQYDYDVAGNLTTVTDERGRISSYTYDDLGRLVLSALPSAGATSFWHTQRRECAHGELLVRRARAHPRRDGGHLYGDVRLRRERRAGAPHRGDGQRRGEHVGVRHERPRHLGDAHEHGLDGAHGRVQLRRQRSAYGHWVPGRVTAPLHAIDERPGPCGHGFAPAGRRVAHDSGLERGLRRRRRHCGAHVRQQRGSDAPAHA
jgi:YD repeat-containing protein